MKGRARPLTTTQETAMATIAKMEGPATLADFRRNICGTLTNLSDRGLVDIRVTLTKRGMLKLDAIAHQRNLSDQHIRRAAKRGGG